jgi:hypothetical protein
MNKQNLKTLARFARQGKRSESAYAAMMFLEWLSSNKLYTHDDDRERQWCDILIHILVEKWANRDARFFQEIVKTLKRKNVGGYDFSPAAKALLDHLKDYPDFRFGVHRISEIQSICGKGEPISTRQAKRLADMAGLKTFSGRGRPRKFGN